MSKTGIPGDILATKVQVETLARLAINIPTEDVRAVVEWLDAQHTVLPILDPTAYMAMGRNIDGHLDLAAAFLKFRLSLDKLVAVEV